MAEITSTSAASEIPKMQYVRLGKTGLKVSRICLGCMSFGSPKWMPFAIEEEQAFPVIKRAIELGINFFDTANIYSNGLSEIILGNALKQLQIPREEVVIATKVFGPVSKDISVHNDTSKPNNKGLSRKHIFEAVEASLKRLQTDYIDLYQIHRWDNDTPIEETMEALHDLVKAGKVRYIGASSMFAWQFAKANFVAKQRGWTSFVSMQDLYNLLYREEEREMIPLCQDLGVGLIPWSPLSMGQLVDKKEEPTNRSNIQAFISRNKGEANKQAEVEIVERARELAKKKGVSTAQVALAWLLSKSAVTAPIVGASRIGTLEDSVRALSVTLTPEDVKHLEEQYLPRKIEGHQ